MACLQHLLCTLASTGHSSASCGGTLASPGRGRGCSGEHDPGMLLKMIYVSPRIEEAREGVQCLLERRLTCANPDELSRYLCRLGVDGDLSSCERRAAAGERRARLVLSKLRIHCSAARWTALSVLREIQAMAGAAVGAVFTWRTSRTSTSPRTAGWSRALLIKQARPGQLCARVPLIIITAYGSFPEIDLLSHQHQTLPSVRPSIIDTPTAPALPRLLHRRAIAPAAPRHR